MKLVSNENEFPPFIHPLYTITLIYLRSDLVLHLGTGGWLLSLITTTLILTFLKSTNLFLLWKPKPGDLKPTWLNLKPETNSNFDFNFDDEDKIEDGGVSPVQWEGDEWFLADNPWTDGLFLILASKRTNLFILWNFIDLSFAKKTHQADGTLIKKKRC